MSQKRSKTIYWVSTILISLMMLFSAFSYFTNDEYKLLFSGLGYPQYFRIELAIAKISGAIALVLPAIPTRVKEWAYAGFTFTYISAAIAHTVNDDPVSLIMQVIITLVILFISYIFFYKTKMTPDNFSQTHSEHSASK